MNETASTFSYLFKVSKEPRNIPLSSIFEFLISLKYNEVELEERPLISDFSFFESSLHQVFV
jgi:hypothetical protein